ncbi:LysR family transcriptional regulator, nitrogen assimilation regulatory protein [Thalassovita litoralis]|jgi:LysR family nitrogen assimilation transcriptional regulator|uniref:LysR family transcriptional regulator, nitrogen assimilation regulatory protein n=2 Tax=Thalassovita litoralis TaxID=1010611 RepID=A0A521C9C2_9RHOB|nr:LysR family transcriptional regulator, nitrogen assimilation regulatory protein [Thalassovita litoralis]
MAALWRGRMDTRKLRYFATIVEEGSFSRAATRLNVAQPALSLHVKTLEQQLGTPLLIREAHGVRPTEAGALLAQRACAVLAELERTEDEIRSFGKMPSGTVRIGLPGTISGILAVPLIARTRERYPRIKIIIAEAMSGFVRDWLTEGRVDLAVLYTELREAGIHSETLLKEELVLLLPPDSPDQPPRAIEGLGDVPLILPSGAHGLRKMVDGYMRDSGVRVDPVIEVDSYTNIKKLVAAGYGCSVLPFHTVAADAEVGTLAVQPFAGPKLWRSAYLAYSLAHPLSSAAGAVSALLKEVVGELIDTGIWAGAEWMGAEREP